MSEEISAFPGMEYDELAGQRYHYGMTLRDYFAGQALQGMIATLAGPSAGHAHRAKAAYQLADAMLQARKEGK